MANLNFNQCNTGGNYPQPISTTRAQLVSLLNANTTTVINPQTEQSFLFANLLVPQEIVPSGTLGLGKQVGMGMAITDNLDSSFFLSQGTYNVEFSANGSAPLESFTLGLVLDGNTVASSVATSTMVGQTVDLSGRAIFVVGQSGGLLSLNNLGNTNATINRATLTINKIS